MPAKFVVQLRVDWKDLKRRRRKDFIEPNPVWVDTEWPSVAKAKQHWPKNEYREVMVEW